jgi:trehalose/maltose hydrolase-like predicted phosphorylase
MMRSRVGIILQMGALCFSLAAGTVVAVQQAGASGAGAAADPASGTGSYLLTATNTGPQYAPTFTGNGELGVRVPPDGQGYEGGAVPTQSELAGFYSQPPGGIQQRANIPTWSTLTFSDAGQPFTITPGTTTNWRQSIDLRTGVITTTARWTAPDGHVTDLSYEVLTDRSRPDVGLVRLEVTPRWSGAAIVTDLIDGAPATLSTQVDKGWTPANRRDWVSVRTMGTDITAAIASQLSVSSNVVATTSEADQTTDQSVGQQLAFPVVAGRSYTFTKYVGVVTSQASATPVVAAQTQAGTAASIGFDTLMKANDTAWATLWAGRIDVLGNPTLATEVNASEFYLWASIRDGVDWSISPAGLSSNSYNGHIFWDAETWMYPALLAQHPDLASGMNEYRFERLAAAEEHAKATGFGGARYPWESALDGTEQIPPPASLFSEGLYEQHITSDIALAQWQYYLATGNKKWLADRGWPVISQAATFWASRVTPGADGTYDIDGVTGPDEENPDVNNEIYTNVSAKETLQNAVTAARVLGLKIPPSWAPIASGIVVPTNSTLGFQPEFAGYDGQLVKQADVTLLEYPWAYTAPSKIEQGDLDYYVPRTDPAGPSMSDSVASIDNAALGTPGCSSYVFTESSVEPFIRDYFDQFSETKGGGAFTFMTGIGGFLQEFLYGYSGLRWSSKAVQISPGLTGQLDGIVLHDLTWHGRRYTVAIGQRTTSVTLNRGAALPLKIDTHVRNIGIGQTLTIATSRPDLSSTNDAVRCGDAVATTSQPGAPALAAVDGSPATDWEPVTLPGTLTVSFPRGPQTVSTAILQWGQTWPSAPTPTQPPPPGPVLTLRAGSYSLGVSLNGRTWRTVATVGGRTTGTRDVLHFPATRARYVSVRITESTGQEPPKLDELTVTP